MKKLVLTLTATLACVAAFAQGKVSFRNDSLHLVYFTTDTSSLLPTDVSMAGQATPNNGALLSGSVIAVDLFAGTSASTLAKVSTTTLAGGFGPGSFGPVSVVLPFAAGSAQSFQIQLYTQSAGSYDAAKAGTMLYYGETPVFTATSGGSITYNSLVATASPSFSTWATGTQALDNAGYGAGAKGSIALQANVPEPTSLALLGLGAAGMMIFRRRK